MGNTFRIAAISIAVVGLTFLTGCNKGEKTKSSWLHWPGSGQKRLELGQADLHAQLETVNKRLEDVTAQLSKMNEQMAQVRTQPPAYALSGAGSGTTVTVNPIPAAPTAAAQPKPLARASVVSPNNASAAAGRKFSQIQPVAPYRPGTAAAVRMPGDILFKSGKVELDAEGRQQVAAMAQVLLSEYPGRPVRVEGFADNDPIHKSNWEDNIALSQQRADAVRNFLMVAGVPQGQVEAVGMGAQKPRTTKALSRRAEVSVVMR